MFKFSPRKSSLQDQFVNTRRKLSYTFLRHFGQPHMHMFYEFENLSVFLNIAFLIYSEYKKIVIDYLRRD